MSHSDLGCRWAQAGFFLVTLCRVHALEDKFHHIKEGRYFIDVKFVSRFHRCQSSFHFNATKNKSYFVAQPCST